MLFVVFCPTFLVSTKICLASRSNDYSFKRSFAFSHYLSTQSQEVIAGYQADNIYYRNYIF